MKFTCYADLREEVEKKLNKLAKKADKYGSKFSYSVGAEYPAKVNVHAVDHFQGVQYVKETVITRCKISVRGAAK